MTLRCAAVIALAGTLALAQAPTGGARAAVSAPATRTFSGSCQFSGPIKPMPPITVVPRSGAHFSYAGKGSCNGTLAGAKATASAIVVTFTDVSTVFDTCELGPDFDLHGTATIGSGTARARFQITINLSRLALAGPFELTTSGGGDAYGVAELEPQSSSAAPQQCASSGVASASLAASFQSLTAGRGG